MVAGALGYQGAQKYNLAAVVEFIHTATLLHDDVVDTSDLRRGKPTANALFGNQASVLVGDFLYSRAFQMMVELKDLRILDALANATSTADTATRRRAAVMSGLSSRRRRGRSRCPARSARRSP